MSNAMVVVLAILVFVAVTIAKGVRIVPQGEEWIVERLGKEVALVVRQPEVQERMEGLGLEPMGDTPADATTLYKDALPKLIKLARDTGVTVD